MNNKIDILIDEEKDYVNNYNVDMLNSDLKNYILEELRGSNLKKGVLINIKGSYINNRDREKQFLKLFRNEFLLSIKDNIMYMKYSIIISLLLSILGIIFIILSNLLHDVLFKEIFLIIGWLGIWESTSNLIFNESKNYIIVKRLKRISEAKIEFFKTD